MAFFDSCLNRLDEFSDFLRRRTRSFSQVLDLVGDDSEAFSVLARLSCDDGGVQREEVRLLGNIIDDV